LVVHLVVRRPTAEQFSALSIKRFGIRIDQPDNNALVTGKTKIEGSIARPLPEGYELRIMRGYPEGGFVPSTQTLCNHNTQRWLVQEFDIGGKKGDARTIEAWMVGPDGRLLLDTWLAAQRVHFGTVSLVRKIAPDDYVTLLEPIERGTVDMYRCDWIRVTKG
jgi:hypothetical protein